MKSVYVFFEKCIRFFENVYAFDTFLMVEQNLLISKNAAKN